MTLAAIIAIALLAAFNAWASIATDFHSYLIGNDTDAPADPGTQAGYTQRLFRMSAFWRAFMVNLSFGGVSLSLAIVIFQSNWGFLDLNNPILPLLLNMVMGILLSFELNGQSRPLTEREWKFVYAGLAVFLYAGLVAFTLYKPPPPKPADSTTTHELRLPNEVTSWTWLSSQWRLPLRL